MCQAGGGGAGAGDGGLPAGAALHAHTHTLGGHGRGRGRAQEGQRSKRESTGHGVMWDNVQNLQDVYAEANIYIFQLSCCHGMNRVDWNYRYDE